MDANRFGLGVRALRQRRGWRQEDLARRAGVSRGVVGRIESGRLDGVPHGKIVLVARALDARADLLLRWQGEGLDRLLDEAHAVLVGRAVELFRAGGWETAVEVSFSIDGERGRYDLLAFHAGTRIVASTEIKSVVPDVGETIGVSDRKARLAPVVARRHGWSCRGVARILLVADTRTARRRVERHESVWRTAFPVTGRATLAWIADPSWPPIDGLAFLSDAHGVSGTPRLVKRVRVRRARGGGSAS